MRKKEQKQNVILYKVNVKKNSKWSERIMSFVKHFRKLIFNIYNNNNNTLLVVFGDVTFEPISQVYGISQFR